MDDGSSKKFDGLDIAELTTRYPVNVDALNKGDRLDVQQVEHLIGCKFEDRNYSLKALRLADWISDEMRKRRGIDVITRVMRGEVVLLTDAEASKYVGVRWDESLGIQRRMIRHSLAIDRDALPDDTARANLDRATTSMAMQYAAAKKERRKAARAEMKPAERKTPALLGVPKKAKN